MLQYSHSEDDDLLFIWEVETKYPQACVKSIASFHNKDSCPLCGNHKDKKVLKGLHGFCYKLLSKTTTSLLPIQCPTDNYLKMML